MTLGKGTIAQILLLINVADVRSMNYIFLSWAIDVIMFIHCYISCFFTFFFNFSLLHIFILCHLSYFYHLSSLIAPLLHTHTLLSVCLVVRILIFNSFYFSSSVCASVRLAACLSKDEPNYLPVSLSLLPVRMSVSLCQSLSLLSPLAFRKIKSEPVWHQQDYLSRRDSLTFVPRSANTPH